MTTAAVGKIYDGWKGGKYRMSESSALWVSRNGCAASTIIVGIEDCDYMTVLSTRWCAK